MDSQEPVFDNVKFEKAKAMARYNRFRKVTRLLQFLEVVVALMLISWSSTRLPGALKVSGKFLFDVADYLFNPQVVFIIVNAIIFAIFVLCRAKGASGEDSGDYDIYDDYVRHSEAQQRKVLVAGGDENPSPEPSATPEIMEMITHSGRGGDDEEEEKQIVLCPPETEEKAEQCDEMTTAIESATKQIEKFQRTHSEKLKREIAAKPTGELLRSETVKVGRRRTERPRMTSFDMMEKLSNDEFNLTIDAFIKQHQKSLVEQKVAENEDVRINYRRASMR